MGIFVVFVVMTREDDAKKFLQERWDSLSQPQRGEIMAQSHCGAYAPASPVTPAPSLAGATPAPTVANYTMSPTSEYSIDCSQQSDPCFADCYYRLKDDIGEFGSALSITGIALIGLEFIMLIASCVLIFENR